MFFRNFVQIILIIASVATDQDCIFFEKESGFVQLLPTPVLREKSVISMEVKAYNCDDISLTIYNGKNYKLSVNNEGMYSTDDGGIENFELSGTCNGLWHDVKLELNEQQPNLYLGGRTSYRTVNGYNLNLLLDAFRDDSLYLGLHFHNRTYHGRRFTKPFEGLIRNIRVDGRVQSINQRRLNGTLVTKACPNELIFTSNTQAAQYSDNVNFNDNYRIYFELKIDECPECCSGSAILLSAITEDSYFFLEIVKNVLYLKMKSQSASDNVRLSSIYDYALCDGEWHKIAVLQQGGDIRLIADESKYSTNYAVKLDFSAPIYIGQHPVFKILSAVEIRNGFKGCFRSLHINGVEADRIEINPNDNFRIARCSKKKILF